MASSVLWDLGDIFGAGLGGKQVAAYKSSSRMKLFGSFNKYNNTGMLIITAKGK